MMNLYLLFENYGSYSHKYTIIYGIFSTKEKAEEEKTKILESPERINEKESWGECWGLIIKEIEIDGSISLDLEHEE